MISKEYFVIAPDEESSYGDDLEEAIREAMDYARDESSTQYVVQVIAVIPALD